MSEQTNILYQDKIPAIAVPKVIDVASRLDIDPNDLMIVFYAESRFSTTIKNSIGCVGLIQFCPDVKGGTTKRIGDTAYKLSDIQKMTWNQQLELCYEYWKPYKNYIYNVYDLYLATFYPLAFKKDDNFKFGSQISEAMVRTIASQNPAISKGSPYITKHIFRDYVKANLIKAGVDAKYLTNEKSNFRIIRKVFSRNVLPITMFSTLIIGSTIYLVVNRKQLKS